MGRANLRPGSKCPPPFSPNTTKGIFYPNMIRLEARHVKHLPFNLYLKIFFLIENRMERESFLFRRFSYAEIATFSAYFCALISI